MKKTCPHNVVDAYYKGKWAYDIKAKEPTYNCALCLHSWKEGWRDAAAEDRLDRDTEWD